MLHSVRATRCPLFCSPAFHTSWDSAPHFGWVCRTHTFLNSGPYPVNMKGRLLITVKLSKPSNVGPISENYKLPPPPPKKKAIMENTIEKTKQQLNCVCHNRLKTAEKNVYQFVDPYRNWQTVTRQNRSWTKRRYRSVYKAFTWCKS